jgi:hypothetical protein
LAEETGEDHASPQPEYLVCRIIFESVTTRIQSALLTKPEQRPNSSLHQITVATSWLHQTFTSHVLETITIPIAVDLKLPSVLQILPMFEKE